MESASRAVVIGGGVLGLEAAWELKKAGLDVQVLEVAPVLMGRQLDAGSAEILKETAAKTEWRSAQACLWQRSRAMGM